MDEDLLLYLSLSANQIAKVVRTHLKHAIRQKVYVPLFYICNEKSKKVPCVLKPDVSVQCPTYCSDNLLEQMFLDLSP